jgi:hypothetical protein
LLKLPVVVGGLVEEVEAVQAAHPADLHAHVEVVLVVVETTALERLFELIHTDHVGFGHQIPVGRFAVDDGNLVGGELEDFVLDSGAFEGIAGAGECHGGEGGYDARHL